MKDAPRLSGSLRVSRPSRGAARGRRPFGPSKPAQAGLESQAGRFAAAVRGGPWTGLLRGRSIFHPLRVAHGAEEH